MEVVTVKNSHAHTCPWWLGYFLANPVRKLIHHPDKILKPYLKEGMKVMDIGSGMGFFSIPIAKLLGESGQVFCIDLQDKMLRSLERRAAKAGVSEKIIPKLATSKSLQISDLKGQIDFSLAFAVVHEVSSPESFFREIHHALQKEGLLLVAEPKNHVAKRDFESSISIAEKGGFVVREYLEIAKSHAVLLGKL